MPNSISDKTFITKKFENTGYEKRIIIKSDYNNLNRIFCEKDASIIYTSSCVAISKDILVFRYKLKTAGVAKICFECQTNQITGTNVNTEPFGQCGEYNKLFDISNN